LINPGDWQTATAVAGAGAVPVSPYLSAIVLNEAITAGDSLASSLSAIASAADLSASVRASYA
jgi:hypothetical protein